jgi:arylsulfatase
VLIADGGRFGGISFYMKDGHLSFCYNGVPPWVYTVRSEAAVPVGHHILSASFAYDGGDMAAVMRGAGGWLTLSVDDQAVAKGRIGHTPAFGGYSDGLDTGQDLITPVSADYAVPYKFTGKLGSVTVKLQ